MNKMFPFRPAAIRRTLPIMSLLAALATTTPHAHAGEADGTYRITRIRAGESLPIPEEIIARAVASGNRITIQDHQITIQREDWLDVLNQFNFVFNGGTPKITGPKSLTLEQSGDSFTGRTSRPVKIALTGSFLGIDITMNLRATCRAKQTGDLLVLTFPVNVSTDGETNASGTVRVVARR